MRVIFDFLYSVRLLKKSPWFTLLSIIVLAGGLTTSLFSFSFLYTLTSKSLPLPEQGTLYRGSLVWQSEAFGERRYLPAYEAAKIRSEADFFSEHGVWQNKTVYLSLGENNLVSSAVRTSPNIFDVSRTQPILGRGLLASDSRQDEQAVVVISYSVWQSQFAGMDDVLGKTVYINDVLTEVVGVMPKGYRFPISHDLWLPIDERILNPLETDQEKVEFFGRLKKGVSPEDAEKQMLRVAEASFKQRANLFPGVEMLRAKIGLFQQFDIGIEMKVFSFALNMLAFFILLLAAINVGNLLFARALQRNKESAIRAALGAPQWRLISQLMWEGFIITFSGTLIALLIVGWLLSMVNVYLHSLMNDELAFWYIWELDKATILAALFFAVATVLIACFWPAFKAARQDFNSVLKDGTRGAQSKQVGRLSRALVTLQIAAIAVVMVLGSVVSTKVHRLTDLQLGYDVTGIYFSIVDLPEYSYQTDNDKSLFFDKLQRGLDNNSAFNGVSVRFGFREQSVAIDGVVYETDAEKPRASVYSLIGSPDFMGPTLVSGRFLDQRDDENGAQTAVISDSMSKRYWPDESPLDQRIQLNLNGKLSWLTIVGVVSDTSNNPFENIEKSDEIYLSGHQFVAQRGTVFFERAGSGVFVEDEFFRVINGIDSQLDILTIEDWELETSAIGKMTGVFRDTIVICGIFSLILAMSGIYGLTVFSVVRRSQEVGIRRALGATDKKITGLFMQQGGRQLLIGLSIGLTISGLIVFAASSILSISNFAYVTIFASVVFSLVTVVMLAILIPSKRAVNIQPSEALRYE